MEIWLARHGATEWSRSGRHTGSTDLPLLPEGKRDAMALGRRLDGHDFARVLSSPMRRAMDTALLAGFGSNVEVSDLLLEYDYGEYEGLTTKDIQAERPGWELFRDGCPGGETPSEVAARAEALLAAIAGADGDVLLIGHGHFLRAVASRYLRLAIQRAGLFRLDAGSLSILGQEHEHPAMLLWNETRRPGTVG